MTSDGYTRTPPDCEKCRNEHGVSPFHIGPDPEADCGHCLASWTLQCAKNKISEPTSGPLGRDGMPFAEKIYTPEELKAMCPDVVTPDDLDRLAGWINYQIQNRRQHNGYCKESRKTYRKVLKQIYRMKIEKTRCRNGEQHDAMPAAPPCQCGGDCGRHREIGVCEAGEIQGKKILCNYQEGDCEHQVFIPSFGKFPSEVRCGRESAALKVAEEPAELPPAMPEHPAVDVVR